MASGVATLLISVGAYQSLTETRRTYYERQRFAHVFAEVERAPRSLLTEIKNIPGIAEVEVRLAKSALLDIAGFDLPAIAAILSIPASGAPRLNSLYLRAGRLPEAERSDEVAVSEGFAIAHGFQPGSTFSAILNGKKRSLTISGLVLSPEFIYSIGPGDLMPDDKRFAVIWMPEGAEAAAFNLEGAFSSLSVRLMAGAKEAEVIRAIDNLLEPFGGTGAYGRKDQLSHAFLNAELEQLETMSRILPPIFLLVTAFLINMILTRLIALEREQIGLLKALGYSNLTIAGHYAKLTALIGIVGLVLGYVGGTALGQGMTQLYAEFFRFPFLVFYSGTNTYVIAGVVSFAAIFLGGARAIHAAMRLAPAVAMRPPTPPNYRRLWGVGSLMRYFSQLSKMVVRYITRWPLRSATSILGISFAVALLVSSMFAVDLIDWMIDTTFHRTDRQDATLQFSAKRPERALENISKLPGVLRVEPFRSTQVVLTHSHFSKRAVIVGKTEAMDLSRVLDLSLNPVSLPKSGLVLGEALADLLHVRRGDMVEVAFVEKGRRKVELPVSDVIQSYLGLAAYMDISALNRALGDGHVISGASLSFDSGQSRAFFAAIKKIPTVMGVAFQGISLQTFRQTVARNIAMTSSVYIALAVVIAFGVAYNSARIQFSERARELASLRVLGFTNAEVSRVLLSEFVIFALVAIPFGWLLGYGLAYAVVVGFESELYRIPLIINRATYAKAGLIVLAAVGLSAAIVRRRVDHLDLVRVLKTRD